MPGAAFLWLMIELESALWHRAGHRPMLWWRDDDARAPSGNLDRLLDLSRDYNTPVTLAVIPDGDLGHLGKLLRERSSVSVIQHGCDHLDRNKEGGFSSEFDPSEPAKDISARINLAWLELQQAFETSPVFAPPWNVLTPNARAALADTPIRAISVYGAADQQPGALTEINTHIDIMKWRPARFRGANTILFRFWRQLRSRRIQGRWMEPVGWLTHHRNLDPAAWEFLETLLRRLNRPGSRFQWRTIDQLLATGSTLRTDMPAT